MQNIALITSGYFTAGGVQTVARWLRGQLLENGYSVTVIDIDPSRTSPLSRRLLRPKTWRKGPQISRNPNETGVISVGTALAEIELLRYAPRNELTKLLQEYDLIQMVVGGPALTLVASRAGVPIALQMATLVRWERKARLSSLPPGRRILESVMTSLVSALEPFALKSASKILVENAEILSALRADHHSGLVYAPPGVDTDRFFAPPAPNRVNGPLICFGRLGDTRKGLDRLIRSYSDAKNNDNSLPELVICGRGKLNQTAQHELEQSTARNSISVLSDMEYDQVIRALQTSSIFIQASHEEGLGIALLEGMACGLPAIATETAGTLETVNRNVNGVLIAQDEFDGNALSAAIRTIRDDYPRFSLSARELTVQNFSNSVAFRRYSEAYESIRAI